MLRARKPPARESVWPGNRPGAHRGTIWAADQFDHAALHLVTMPASWVAMITVVPLWLMRSSRVTTPGRGRGPRPPARARHRERRRPVRAIRDPLLLAAGEFVREPVGLPARFTIFRDIRTASQSLHLPITRRLKARCRRRSSRLQRSPGTPHLEVMPEIRHPGLVSSARFCRAHGSAHCLFEHEAQEAGLSGLPDAQRGTRICRAGSQASLH
jgi:hypothetical protein